MKRILRLGITDIIPNELVINKFIKLFNSKNFIGYSAVFINVTEQHVCVKQTKLSMRH